MKKILTPYEKLMEARKPERLNIHDYINGLFQDFYELHGDRLYKDDPSIVGGIGFFHGQPVTVIGHKKGRSTEENIACNFGMTSPEGYRKARRLMEQAEKFGRPVITLIDTPGAYPGVEAESNGQSNAISENLAFMSRLTVPTIAIVTGEGSSGGALAMAVSDRIYMMENAVFSILSPEGFAAIMWKDKGRAAEACEMMKITADELLSYGLIDGILPEGKKCIAAVDRMLCKELEKLNSMRKKELINDRYNKFRKFDGLYQRR